MYDTLFVHLFQVVFSSSPRPMIPASNADEIPLIQNYFGKT